MCRLAQLHEHDLTLISFADGAHKIPGQVQNFKPVGQFTLPENETVTLAFPPFLDILEYCERRQLTELIISTPGWLGWRRWPLERCSTFAWWDLSHRPTPNIRHYTEDDPLESAAWRYLRWSMNKWTLSMFRPGFTASSLRPRGSLLENFTFSSRN